MSLEKILVIDSDPVVRNFLYETLSRKKIEVTALESGQQALHLLENTSFDLIICDLLPPSPSGHDILRKVKEHNPHTPFVMITASGSIESSVETMRLGAFHYLVKPFSADAIEAIIEKATEHLQDHHSNHTLPTNRKKIPKKIIGESPIMKQILADVSRVANTNSSIFITGESGTGKEVIAQAIHFHSQRTHRPFIKVNCAAVPETLVESEFFGHEKGAFTGAVNKRLGRFELAHGGSLLLDEVTEIPIGLQAKLLRVTQEREFERVGGTKLIQVDVRLISTSNRNIKEALEQKILRKDLFYRLNVVPFYLPPLRERKEDIIPLAEYFLERVCLENSTDNRLLTADAKKRLLAYSWPGNIRELSNVIERAVVLNSSPKITAAHLYLEN